MRKFDLIVLGAGPGGYVAAIRASQLGKKVAIIERDKLGGVCLNRGCIPTKALLKAAHSVHEIKSLKTLGINVELKSLDAAVAVTRAFQISDRVGKGVAFLMKKNGIEVIVGDGKLKSKREVEVTTASGQEIVEADNIIIATGASYKTFPGLIHDGERLIGAWEAIKMEILPKSMAIVGAGAIGVEFAYFWNAFGVEVHIFEVQNHLLPLEDEESSLEIEKSYKKYGIKLSLGIKNVTAQNTGEQIVISCERDGVAEEYKFEKGLIAVGMSGNVAGIGLENVGVGYANGFIKVDEFCQTNIPGIYAIGDVSGPPLLAHVASHEGIIAAEHLAGLHPHPINKSNVAGCTYSQPQVASVGMTEKQLKEKNIEYKVGKMPFRSNGKALASNENEGQIKVLLGKEGQLLGAHIVGNIATEMIHELVLFKQMEGVEEEIYNTIHPHPTLGEWIAEAVMAANNRAIHG
ncbi:MAG: dihydrolipoyl dehydrogenase [Bdellovibrionales bacterium RIFOXYD12_FULL_39_22]|nr:MAG: dihydrolipoyl dehydrogenase [Bdellovibrionales bacterium RIFOXYB1_FULL_39_21]OFZ40827.1 MAG: dihydrolipoyl dehydrogenase [Bdellovibrionales bacterium RIFOXYC12_FULL_39_17]OFZ44368.1 MAG: dihydrolipoyl dehydrogenase [Bdellovibrionales bacterium RIFOXYC1_FULL_39_130]OFZ74115.1 MAG: dihydrolipoyl dehydrogenase [Bdellovibrionales bacterium RIFOXYD1_FULL_39_84]OFZ91964.1 MAG: dihydrolipoyl dehydrogenase [Bdellovibrionales bacterium RIFOXYD12_FULL_39_22]HLE12279.1 dihydrolipoyl dehydrogenase